MSPLVSDVLLRAQSDERLAKLAGEGQARAFGVLVERYRKPLLRFATRLAGATAADDLVQQALLRAWTSLSAGGEVRQVRAWLYQIVRNAHLSELARSHAQESLGEDVASAATTAELAETHMRLSETVAAMAKLPDQQRLALTEMELGGRSRHEVAGALGLSEGAVRQLLYRARMTLRQVVTILTPLQLAEWAARPRGGSRLAAQVAELGGATGAGTGAVAAGSAGSGLLGGGLAVKGIAAAIAAAGALGGAIVVVLPHNAAKSRVRHLAVAPVAVIAGAVSTQDRSGLQSQASSAAAGKPSVRPHHDSSHGAHRRGSAHHAQQAPAGVAQPMAITYPSTAPQRSESTSGSEGKAGVDRSHASAERTSAAPERQTSSTDHHSAGSTSSDETAVKTTEVTISSQTSQDGEEVQGSKDSSGASPTEVTSETTSETTSTASSGG